MENKIIKTKDLKLARVKYFDSEHNGVELTPIEAYAFIQWSDEDQRFVNLFDDEENLPVYARSLYPNVAPNGEEYGNRLINVYGPVENGPCFVIEPVDVSKLLDMKAITWEGLKEYVLHSDKFFVDRIPLIENEKPSRRIRFMKKLISDHKHMAELRAYMSSRRPGKQFINMK